MASEATRVEVLIGRHLDGLLDAEQSGELTALLAADSESRKLFARSVALDTLLPPVVQAVQAEAPPSPFIWRRPAWTAALAAAAMLAVATTWWHYQPESGPQLDHGLVLRDGKTLSQPPRLQRGDVIQAVGGPTTVVWADEGTRVTLPAGSTLTLVQSGPDKDLLLQAGEMDVEAGKQTADRHLQVRAGRLVTTVVGTRFHVENHGDGGGLVTVEHGAVAVSDGTHQQTVAAGQTLFAGAVGQPWVSPTGGDMSAVAQSGSALLNASIWTAEHGQGWVGTLGDGVLHSKVIDATSEKIQNSERLEGYLRLAPNLSITADVSLGKAGTVAVFLVCRRPDGRDWLGNYCIRENLGAGRHQRRWTFADLQLEKGAPLSEATGGRVISVVIGAWPQPVGLTVRSLSVTTAQ